MGLYAAALIGIQLAQLFNSEPRMTLNRFETKYTIPNGRKIERQLSL